MQTVSLKEAQAQLPELVEAAVEGEPFIITRSGKPAVKVTVMEAEPAKKPQRLGWAKGENWVIPDDFNRWAEDEIREMFEGRE